MHKLITLITATIALTACRGNSSEVDKTHQDLPLTYHFDETLPQSQMLVEGEIEFDQNCFYIGHSGERLAIIFPNISKWDKTTNTIIIGSKIIKSGDKISTNGGMLSRERLISDKKFTIHDSSCVTESLMLIGTQFQ